MKVQWHVASAIPFLVAGHPFAALACVLPDLPWLFQEVKYRARLNVYGWIPWHTWIRNNPPSENVLEAYRITHSSLIALSLAASTWYDRWQVGVWWLTAGWLTHHALDLLTHDGAMRAMPFYPFRWRVPRSWVLKRYRVADDAVFSAVCSRTHVVLLSGGWESAVCLAKAVEEAARTRVRVIAVFVDYGQPYRRQEERASLLLAQQFGVYRSIVHIPDLVCVNGVFTDRNYHIIRAVVDEWITDTVWFGCRAPGDLFDSYGDSNHEWAQRVGHELCVKVRTPFIMWPKWLVKRAAARYGIKGKMVFSSEGYVYE